MNARHLPPMIISPDGSYRELGMTGPLMSELGGAWRSETIKLGPVRHRRAVDRWRH